jgi:hypothetical protein
MKILMFVSGLVLAAVIGAIVLMLRPQPVAVAPTPKREETAEPPTPPKPLPPTVDAHPQIRQAVIEAKPKLRSPRDVDGYLADLEAQARRKHQVTALEVEPAIAAIRSQYPHEEAKKRIAEYTARMSQLSAELDGRDPNQP